MVELLYQQSGIQPLLYAIDMNILHTATAPARVY